MDEYLHFMKAIIMEGRYNRTSDERKIKILSKGLDLRTGDGHHYLHSEEKKKVNYDQKID